MFWVNAIGNPSETNYSFFAFADILNYGVERDNLTQSWNETFSNLSGSVTKVNDS